MTRRDVNWLFMQALAAAPQLIAQNHSHFAPADPHKWNSYQPKFFDAEEFKILDSFTAILIPTDDTPGAREAGVAAFIDFAVNAAAEFSPETQTEWRSALKWLKEAGFATLSESRQNELIAAMSAPEQDTSKTHPGFPTYRLIKENAVRAYYTSRPGLIEALEYQGIGYLAEFPACQHPEHRQV